MKSHQVWKMLCLVMFTRFPASWTKAGVMAEGVLAGQGGRGLRVLHLRVTVNLFKPEWQSPKGYGEDGPKFSELEHRNSSLFEGLGLEHFAGDNGCPIAFV
jgi:hypothetical protein